MISAAKISIASQRRHRGTRHEQGVVAAVGLVIGLAGALALSRVFSSLLFAVGATDPSTLVAVVSTFAIVPQ